MVAVVPPFSNIRSANGAVSRRHSTDRIVCLLRWGLGVSWREVRIPHQNVGATAPEGASLKAWVPANPIHCHTSEVLFHILCLGIYSAVQK